MDATKRSRRAHWSPLADRADTVGDGRRRVNHPVHDRPFLGLSAHPLTPRALLGTQTPYRSVVSYPLTHGLAGVGALVIYLQDPAGRLALDSIGAQTAVNLVSAELTGSAVWATRYRPGLRHWIDTPGARVRAITWQAVTLIKGILDIADADALAILRARAYSSGRLVDEIASDLVTGTFTVADLNQYHLS